MSQQSLSVLISGAGVAGASLALALVRQPGFTTQLNITLIERSPIPRTTGQALDIRGPGVDVIRKFGLEPEIKANHTTETGLAFLNSKGAVAATFLATGDAKRQSASSEYEILRGDLTRILFDAISEARQNGAKVQVVYDEYIQTMIDREDGTGVDVCFSNDRIPNQKYDVVVGADGIASKTRSMMFGSEDRKEHVKPSGLYIGFFTIPRIASDDSLWRWCQLPSGLAMHLRPHCNGKTMGVYLTMCNPTESRNPELEEILHADIASQKIYLRQRFQKVGWQSSRFLDGLDACDDFYMTHWCRVVTPQWSSGRYVTLGDAAFATMGVGTSLAMTGAYCLSGELSKIAYSEQVPQALRTYEKLFRPWVEQHQKPHLVGMQLANPQTAWGIWVVQAIMRIVAILRLPQLLTRFFPAEERVQWQLPDYGW